MRRIVIVGGLVAGISLCLTGWAQEVTLRGYVQKVDPVNFKLTLRTTGNPRVVQVAPSAVVMIGGKAGTIEQIPLNSQVSIVGVKDSQNVTQATQITVETSTNLPPAASGPGALIRGVVVGVDPPSNSIRVRTLTGDLRVPLGTAPIMANGVQKTSASIRLGDNIEIHRQIGTDAGTELTTRLVTITGRTASYRASSGAQTRTSAHARSRSTGSRNGTR